MMLRIRIGNPTIIKYDQGKFNRKYGDILSVLVVSPRMKICKKKKNEDNFIDSKIDVAIIE